MNCRNRSEAGDDERRQDDCGQRQVQIGEIPPRWQEGRGARWRDHLAGRQAFRHRYPASLLLPEPGYRADGNCRACMVEIEGERVLAASCIRKPTEGMKVKTASDRAKTARQMVFELLIADQPDRKTVAHDPQSKFWAWADRMNIGTSRFPAHGRPAP